MFHRAPSATLAHRETTGRLDSLTRHRPPPYLKVFACVQESPPCSLWRHKGNEHGHTLQKHAGGEGFSILLFFCRGGGAVNRGLNQPLLKT